MIPLSSQQRRRFKADAHHLKVVVSIGQHGLSDNVLAEIEIALEHHELIKIKIPALDRSQRHHFVDKICKETHSQSVAIIGRVAIVYRKSKKNS